ncbi:hypothetical protein PSTG_19659 [Puccinia striiformis f. sp. tritici PST-78]|uniref:Uncharacterized protein n=1 Tax=Puccinia striiformis f. sp. tritici PST-78 TaxID=1165861 RepID=A0A0L0UIS6_9BASI|nr:hypothetical protein PSTG_19659 [Puccinia striiformis f. sp. tritici PST-78]
MAQIKLHLLQGDPLSAAGRKEFRSAPESTQYNSKYKDMKTYKLQVSLTPAKLEVFGEGIFTESQISALFRRRHSSEQPTDMIDINGIEDNKAEESDLVSQEL